MQNNHKVQKDIWNWNFFFFFFFNNDKIVLREKDPQYTRCMLRKS